MEALWLWICENAVMLVIAVIECVGLYVWKEKNPDRWIKWKKKKIKKFKKLRDINLKQIQYYTVQIEILEKELEK